MIILWFLVRRIAGGLLLLVILSLLVYALVAASPGSPVQVLLGNRPPTPDLIRALEAKYHLGDPFFVQYWDWLRGVATLHLGVSIAVQTDTSVLSIIGSHTALSLELAGYALVIVLLFGIPLGMAAGIRRGTALDRGISLVATVGISAPTFAVSILLLYVFGVSLAWLPVYGIGNGVTDRIVHLTLPAFALAGFLMAIVIRQMRASALTIMDQDFITFARARGLSPNRILVRYAFRNASLPVVTSAGLLLIVAITATVFIEQVFSLPGDGSLLLSAVTDKDIPLVQGLALFLGALVIGINILVDLLSLLLDPRTRIGQA